MKEKKINIEFMRIIAILSTIVIHVSNIYIRSFGNISNGNFLISTIYNACARICVPVFFMISGALLIKGEYNREKYLKRIKKFIIILAVWSIIYYIVNDIRGGSNDIIKAMVYTFFDTTYTSKHLWFMYAIIAMYLVLPFINNMCKNLTREQENLFMILWMSISGLSVIYLPLAKAITGHSIDVVYPVPLINGAYYLGYFICGHILYERLKDIKTTKKYNLWCILTFVLSVVIIAGVTYYSSIKHNHLMNTMLWYRSIFIILESFAVFIYIVINSDKFKNPNINKIASLSFGVYLVHAIILFIIKDNINMISYSPIIFIPIFTFIIFMTSLLISFIMKKIPIINKII